MIKVVSAVLLVVSLVLLTIFSKVLYKKDNNELYQFSLPSLFDQNEVVDTKELKGKPYIINVFASWCTTCHEDHKLWVDVTNRNIVNIYGVDYIDNQSKAKEWLKSNGNPYVKVAVDNAGHLGKILGITGVPETFVFDRDGKMVFHVSGIVTVDIWNNQIKQLVSE